MQANPLSRQIRAVVPQYEDKSGCTLPYPAEPVPHSYFRGGLMLWPPGRKRSPTTTTLKPGKDAEARWHAELVGQALGKALAVGK